MTLWGTAGLIWVCSSTFRVPSVSTALPQQLLLLQGSDKLLCCWRANVLHFAWLHPHPMHLDLTICWRSCVLSVGLHKTNTSPSSCALEQKQSCWHLKWCRKHISQYTHTARGIFGGALFKNACYKLNTITSVQHRGEIHFDLSN